jgi:hypothetical protein
MYPEDRTLKDSQEETELKGKIQIEVEVQGYKEICHPSNGEVAPFSP